MAAEGREVPSWAHVAWFDPAHLPADASFDSKWRGILEFEAAGGREDVLERVAGAVRQFSALRSTALRGSTGTGSVLQVSSVDNAVHELRSTAYNAETVHSPPPDSACNARLLLLMGTGSHQLVRLPHGFVDAWAVDLVEQEIERPGQALDLHRRTVARERSAAEEAHSAGNVADFLAHSRHAVRLLGRPAAPTWPDGPARSFVERSTELAALAEAWSTGLRVSRAAMVLALTSLCLAAATGQPAAWLSVLSANRTSRDEPCHVGLMMCRGSAFVELRPEEQLAELVRRCGRALFAALRNSRFDPAMLRAAAAADTPALSAVDLHVRESRPAESRNEPEPAPSAPHTGFWRPCSSTGGFAVQISVHLLFGTAEIVVTTDGTHLDDDQVETVGALLRQPRLWGKPTDRPVLATVDHARAVASDRAVRG